jgi:hypothetical protein
VAVAVAGRTGATQTVGYGVLYYAFAVDEVLVRVHAPGVNRGVWHLMTGLPYPIRLVGAGLRAPKTPNPGNELAGSWRRSAAT